MNNSEKLFIKAQKIIPWGTQTNAKRPNESYAGIMPYYIEKGKGCRLTDIDGKEYIDYRLSLGPVTLGYCYPEVDEAVRRQIEKGVLFSMASPIEYDLAEMMKDVVPSAQMVRFMKTGEEANSALLRLARSYTKNDLMITCGYHGFPEWFTSTIPNNGGIPKFIHDYVKDIPYGNLEIAEKVIKENLGKIACVFTIPYDFNENISKEFLVGLRKITAENNIPLIFDEVLTGFRLAKGGAQEYFGVTPDLSSFAKAMANGYPISAFVGKEEIMKELDNVLITTTYAGETLSIAASIATINIMNREDVHGHLYKMGKILMNGFDEICKELGVEACAAGLPPSSFFKFNYEDKDYNAKIKDIFFRELFRNGIFVNPSWFICYSHKEEDIYETLEKIRISLKYAKDNN